MGHATLPDYLRSPRVAYVFGVMWPGITEPLCYLCTWTYYQNVYQIKYVNNSCPKHGKR